MSSTFNELQQEVLELLESSFDAGYDINSIKTISSGFAVFDLYTGGLPVGGPLVLIGTPGAGKSTLAQCLCAKLEQQYKSAFSVYVDNEFSLDEQRMKLLNIQHALVKVGLTLEEIDKLLDNVTEIKKAKNITDPTLFVWDTYANTMTDKEMKLDDPTKATGWKVRLLGHMLPKMIAKCINHNIAFIIVNQLRDVIAMDSYITPAKELKYMPFGKDMPGGNPLKFNAFTLLYMKNLGKVQDAYGFSGSKVEFLTVKCKKRSDGAKFTMIFDHSTGFDDIWSICEFLIQEKAIVPAGAYRRFKDYPEKSFHLKDFKKKYLEDSEFRNIVTTVFNKHAEQILAKLGRSLIVDDNDMESAETIEQTTDTSNELEQLVDSVTSSTTTSELIESNATITETSESSNPESNDLASKNDSSVPF